jgi:Transcriptional regulator containing an amidase domain and an AraC-type DNA-binding HTH domain
MEKNVTTVPGLIAWIDRVKNVPIVFAEADQREVLQTEPRPLLELVLVRRGRFQLEVGELRRPVEPGDVAWINAHHGNRAELAGTGARYACVSIDVGGREEFRRLGRAPVLELMRGPSLEWSEEAFGEVVRWHRSPAEPLRETMLRASLIRLLGGLSLAGEAPEGAARPARLQRALAVLEARSAEAELTIDEVARAAGMSNSTLRRMFVEHLAMTPVQYLQDLRLARARDFLAKTSLGVKEVAARVGYADPLYFSKAFRRKFGRTPSEARGR